MHATASHASKLALLSRHMHLTYQPSFFKVELLSSLSWARTSLHVIQCYALHNITPHIISQTPRTWPKIHNTLCEATLSENIIKNNNNTHVGTCTIGTNPNLKVDIVTSRTSNSNKSGCSIKCISTLCKLLLHFLNNSYANVPSRPNKVKPKPNFYNKSG